MERLELLDAKVSRAVLRGRDGGNATLLPDTTGIALVNDGSSEVVWAAELMHRGGQIKRDMDKRRVVRKSRRQRKTRYRQPRFDNRRKRKGTLPPSQMSRVCNMVTWIRRLMRLCPLSAISQELDHLQPRAKLGSNRVSNLVAACKPCNQCKGNQDIRDFLKEQPQRLARILAQAKTPLRDAAAGNATRWIVYEPLKAFGLPVECGSGGLTKFNRIARNLPKTHWLDAACVGRSTSEEFVIKHVVPLRITATGHGSRQMCRMDEHGFPRTKPKGAKRVKGFQTGDLVRAVVTSGTEQGTYVGRVAVRTRGVFNIKMAQGTVTGIHYRFCTRVSRSDGYSYDAKKEASLPPTA